GVRHVGDQHVAGLDALHLGRPRDHAHDAGRDLRAHGAPDDEGLAAALHAVAGEDAARAALHGLGARLHDVDQAVLAVLDPLDVHGPAVVVLDRDALPPELVEVVVVEREARPVGRRHRYPLDAAARGVDHLLGLGAELAREHGGPALPEPLLG